jgi:glycosyltransferase involved in cell wall biosynthesis
MKIAILGTRGIPNHYGGFEQITENLSAGLAAKGHEVFVYNSHNHPYQHARWGEVNIVHCYDPEYWLKTAGQFVYDLNCIRDARKKDFDIILIMGYSSSSVWKDFFPRKSTIIYNMDGLEWKRTKYSPPVRKFLQYAERLAARHSHFHIADSTGIQQHLWRTYGIKTEFIPYGANVNRSGKADAMDRFGLHPQNYFMVMARMEPENNVDMILQGFSNSGSEKEIIVVGNTGNSYGRRLVKKYRKDRRIKFLNALFDQEAIHTLRQNCCLYFHGHSVGGTNPSLLEAMADRVLIAAHDNDFNRSVLDADAFYFSNAADIERLVASHPVPTHDTMIANNYEKIELIYNWKAVIDHYDKFLCSCFEKMKNEQTLTHRRHAYE